MASSTPLITGKESYWGALNLDESTVALMNKSETFRHYAADYETAVSKEGLKPITVGGDLADYFERGKGIHMGQDLQTLPSEVLIGLLSHELSHFENRASDAAFEKKYAVNPYDPNAFAMKAMTSMHAESEAALDNVKVAHEIDDATGGQSKIFVSGALMADKNHNRIDTGLQKAFDEQHAKDVQNHLTAEQDRNLMIASGMGVLSVVPTSADPETPAYMFYGDVNNAPRPEDGTVTHATLQDANGSGNISSMSQTWSSGHTVTQQFNGTKLEPPRILWRLQLLREWSHEQEAQQVFPGSPRARSAPGTRAA